MADFCHFIIGQFVLTALDRSSNIAVMAVYFIRAEGSGLVKIGFAENPWLRLSKIGSDCPWPVSIVALEDGRVEREAEFHERFASYRQQGEWFREEGELASYLASAAAPIRERRTPKNVAEVAEAAGVSKAQASRIIAGRSCPPPETVARIFRATSRKFGILAPATDEEADVVCNVIERAAKARGEAR